MLDTALQAALAEAFRGLLQLFQYTGTPVIMAGKSVPGGVNVTGARPGCCVRVQGLSDARGPCVPFAFDRPRTASAATLWRSSCALRYAGHV